nr:hypothetical protein BN993_04381 [Virgibacillus halodenitrificans]
MDTSLEALLVFACLEIEGSSESVVVDAFSETMKIFLKNKELFERLPSVVVKTSESLKTQTEAVGLAKDLETNFGEDVEEHIEHFDEKALLIYDGIEASAFGRMSYFYRSKGIRFYLFDNGKFNILTPYSYMDHHGFQLENSIWESCGPDFTKLSVETVRDHIHLTSEDYNNRDPKQFVCGQLLKMLCSVKEKFHKDYYLEYLLTPPDVDKLSEFSKYIRSALWDICLSKDFSEKWGKRFQHASMNILSSLEIAPSPGQLVDFIKSNQDGDITLKTLLEKLNELQDNIVEANRKESIDMLELKPNFFGIGINFNEVYSRVKDSLQKPNK